jgi:hypothetical protein
MKMHVVILSLSVAVAEAVVVIEVCLTVDESLRSSTEAETLYIVTPLRRDSKATIGRGL